MVDRRRLRMELREARARVGLSQRQVATKLEWSVSKVIRIESGRVSPSRSDLTVLLDLYGITEESTRVGFIDLARNSRPQPGSEFADVLSPDFRIYLDYELSAIRLRQYEQDVLPGVLQTPEYAEALIRAVALPGTSNEVILRQRDARTARKATLNPDSGPSRMAFIVDEAVLRREVGGAPGDHRIMLAQLAYLKQVAERPKIDIQVLPFSHGAHFALRGSFVLLEFDQADGGDLLYFEGSRGGSVISRDNPEEINLYKATFESLSAAATPPASLPTVVDRIAAQMSGDDLTA
jgi:transcriptional regulator with XRE-family HTH domain